MAWHRRKAAGPILRLIGAILLATAWMVGKYLFCAPTTAPDAIDGMLALILFTSASAGSALLVLGAHLFDAVARPSPWQRRF